MFVGIGVRHLVLLELWMQLVASRRIYWSSCRRRRIVSVGQMMTLLLEFEC